MNDAAARTGLRRAYAPLQLAPTARVAVLALPLLLVFVLAGCDLGSSSSGSGLGSPGQTVTVPPAAQDLQQTVVNVIRTVQPSVVQVTSSGGQGGAIGSGEVLTKDGYIATNDHVVSGFSSFAVTLSNGSTVNATLVGGDAQDDLAVLRISTGNLQPIALADSRKVLVGEFAIAIGSPAA